METSKRIISSFIIAIITYVLTNYLIVRPQNEQTKEQQEQIQTLSGQIQILQQLDQASTDYRLCKQKNCSAECKQEDFDLYHTRLKALELGALPN